MLDYGSRGGGGGGGREGRGVWQPQTEASLDIRIIETDAPLYIHRTLKAVLESEDKKRL